MKVISKTTKNHHLQKHQERMQIVNLLAMGNAMENNGIEHDLVVNVLCDTMSEMHSMATELLNNTVVENGITKLDKEYNYSSVFRLAAYYGIHFDERIFA